MPTFQAIFCPCVSPCTAQQRPPFFMFVNHGCTGDKYFLKNKNKISLQPQCRRVSSNKGQIQLNAVS